MKDEADRAKKKNDSELYSTFDVISYFFCVVLYLIKTINV